MPNANIELAIKVQTVISLAEMAIGSRHLPVDEKTRKNQRRQRQRNLCHHLRNDAVVIKFRRRVLEFLECWSNRAGDYWILNTEH